MPVLIFLHPKGKFNARRKPNPGASPTGGGGEIAAGHQAQRKVLRLCASVMAAGAAVGNEFQACAAR